MSEAAPTDPDTKLPAETMLTVIIRNEGPYFNLQEPCTNRTVRIQLTPGQVEKLRLSWHSESWSTEEKRPKKSYEVIASCFLEKPHE